MFDNRFLTVKNMIKIVKNCLLNIKGLKIQDDCQFCPPNIYDAKSTNLLFSTLPLTSILIAKIYGFILFKKSLKIQLSI